MNILCSSLPAAVASGGGTTTGTSTGTGTGTGASSALFPPKRPLLEPLKNRLVSELERGRVDHAFHILDEMSQRGVPPDIVTYSLFLKACILRRDLRRGRLLHRRLLASGLELDSVAYNSLLALYTKCGDLPTARTLFRDMGNKRDVVSWNTMIWDSARRGAAAEAVALLREMLESGFEPNGYCFAGLLQGLSGAEYLGIGLVVFGLAIKAGSLHVGWDVGSGLIDLFAKAAGDMASARKVFDRMTYKNIVVWTLMITRYVQYGDAEAALIMFIELLEHGLKPDRFTMTSVVSACSEFGSYRVSQQLHSLAVRLGLDMDVCVGCSLLDMYAKSMAGGSMSESRMLFDRMPEHSVMSWTSLITGYVQNGGQDAEAIRLFCRMIEGNIRPNHFTFSIVLKACASLADSDIGRQVYAYVVKSGFAAVSYVGNSLVSMFAKAGRVEEARKAFDVMFDRDLVSYSAIVDGYVKNSENEKAFELLRQMVSSDFGANAFTFASLLSAAAGTGSISKGQQLHGWLLKAGLQLNQGVANALLSMYSRCGGIEDAWLAFREMGRKDDISWTSMIMGFAIHGDAVKALQLFDEMIKSDSEPTDITYVAVLSACSHAGLVQQGWEHFHCMQRVYGIVPKMDHYGCMVDLLGRSGRLAEAVHFINSMPFIANAVIWRTLLSASRVYSDMEIGELAARKILELEPHDSAAHVLLSNLYASKGQWDVVAATRSHMKQLSVTKEAGFSWMEIKNTIHGFYVGDTQHPRAREIYAKLDEMVSEIKRMGYIPDLDHYIHEVEEVHKEHYLFQHSERIAVAFGLISTSAPMPIRIFKNLRICQDCHEAIKFISKAYDRVIILRDTNRFHCFQDGVCSCLDYW